MTVRVVWRSSARHDLAAITRFIADQNPWAAKELKAQVESVTALLGHQPYMGRRGRVSGTREVLIHPNYWLIYRVGSAVVEVVSVLHSRQKYP